MELLCSPCKERKIDDLTPHERGEFTVPQSTICYFQSGLPGPHKSMASLALQGCQKDISQKSLNQGRVFFSLQFEFKMTREEIIK